MASVVLVRFFLLAAICVLFLASRSAEGYSICSDPSDYVGYVVDDPWRNRRYRGECVSFVKVILQNYNIQFIVTFQFDN